MNEEAAKQAVRALYAAITAGDVDRVAELIGEDRELLTEETVFGSFLHVAADNGNLAVVKLLVSLGADVNARGGILGGTPLNSAASVGASDIVRFLLSQGATLDVDKSQWNPLFSAIYGGHTETARLLIESGIDTAVKYSGDNMQDTDALAFARQWGRHDIVGVLAPDSHEDLERERTSERALHESERDAVSQAQDAAREMLGLSSDALPLDTQERIHGFLTGLFTAGDGSEVSEINTLGEDCPIALGALWGEAVCAEFGWEWIIAMRGEWEGIGISDPERRWLALPMSYFGALVETPPVEANLPSLQLYNCLHSGNLPISSPGSYTLIAHAGT